MSKKIKVLSMVVSFVMLLTMLTVSAAAPFSDLNGSSAEQVITRWYDAGLISGYPDGTFKPEATVTRAQFAKIISNLFVLDGAEAEFADVSAEAWYHTYVQKASAYMSCCEADESGNCDKRFMPEQAMDMKGAVEILSLQAEGGKRMAAPDYFRGHPLKN